jgi:hypothetical protein
MSQTFENEPSLSKILQERRQSIQKPKKSTDDPKPTDLALQVLENENRRMQVVFSSKMRKARSMRKINKPTLPPSQ